MTEDNEYEWDGVMESVESFRVPRPGKYEVLHEKDLKKHKRALAALYELANSVGMDAEVFTRQDPMALASDIADRMEADLRAKLRDELREVVDLD